MHRWRLAPRRQNPPRQLDPIADDLDEGVVELNTAAGIKRFIGAPDRVRDPFEKNVPGIGVGRDGCRTPMQWDATTHAGFSTASTWLPLADDFVHENVVNLEAEAASILSLYKALIALRKQLSPLVTGSYEPVAAQGNILLYRRVGAAGTIVIALNLGAEPRLDFVELYRRRPRNPSLHAYGSTGGAHRRRTRSAR
jgi:hypothetical protein